MKSCRLMLIFLLVWTTCFAQPPKTKDDFLAAVRAAFEAKDLKRIHELTWEKGASEEDLQLDNRALSAVVPNMKGIEKITLNPMPSDYVECNIANGKRYGFTCPPTGVVEFETSGEGGSRGYRSMLYAVIDGGYYLVATKSTDLGWKGPQDKILSVSVPGRSGKVAIHIKYNASGVDLESDEKPCAVANSSRFKAFRGQYIEEVTVVSDDDDVEATLELRQDQQYPAGLFYKSEPLKGKGQIHYKKGDTGVPLQ